VTPTDELLEKAKKALSSGDREAASALLVQAADSLSSKGAHGAAAKLYEQAAQVYRDLSKLQQYYDAIEKAILMLVRQEAKAEAYSEIVRLSVAAAKTAERATQYKRAADFYFRAAEFAATEDNRTDFNTRAADALEGLADTREDEKNFSEAVALLKKVARLYYASGDNELGARIDDRSQRIALRWAEASKSAGDMLSAGNALAEVAQVMQLRGDMSEAPRTMMEAGELYQSAGLFEKAGNIYDAAQEAFEQQRLTGARKQALLKSAEAYLKMEGAPEVLAPLLVKAGGKFAELGNVKAKWAYKRAGELFGVLAEKAAKENEVDAQKDYLRHQAMCLKLWGSKSESAAIYQQVVDYYLAQSKTEEKNGNREQQAVSLEELADVLSEMGDAAASHKHLLAAQDIYVSLAEEKVASAEMEDASKFYGKAGDCADKLGDEEKHSSFHKMACERALDAANLYESMSVPELATVWMRNAGAEALGTNDPEMAEKAIGFFRQSAEGFKKINESDDAFEDFFQVFEITFGRHPEAREQISSLIKEMEDIAKSTRKKYMLSVVTVLRILERGDYHSALLTLQAKEEDLLPKVVRIRKLVELCKTRSKTA
jgi:tetratricopeptide (TPR) repeat protein